MMNNIPQRNFAVIDTETNWNNQIMSIGIVIADVNTYNIVNTLYYIITPEAAIGGFYSDVIEMPGIPNRRYRRSEAISNIHQCFAEYDVKSIFAYNATFDYNHLPELSVYMWHDIMKLAAYKQYNPWISRNAECCSTGRLKKNYNVEAIMRMLTGNPDYFEKHNALCDAVDELRIMQLLGHRLEKYAGTMPCKGR